MQRVTNCCDIPCDLSRLPRPRKGIQLWVMPFPITGILLIATSIEIDAVCCCPFLLPYASIKGRLEAAFACPLRHLRGFSQLRLDFLGSCQCCKPVLQTIIEWSMEAIGIDHELAFETAEGENEGTSEIVHLFPSTMASSDVCMLLSTAKP